MRYVIDAHALVWYFTQDARLGTEARTVLQRIDTGKDEGLVPAIVLAEILYLSERGRISVTLDSAIKELRNRKGYRIVALSQGILLTAQRIKDVPELHDRLIAATAMHHQGVVITRDTDISASRVVKSVW